MLDSDGLKSIFTTEKEAMRRIKADLTEIEKDKLPSGEGKRTSFWDIFDKGAHGHEGYFSLENSPDSFGHLIPFESAKHRLQDLRESGVRNVVLDIMGQGRVGVDLGADLSVCWTLNQMPNEVLPHREVERGDIFEKKDRDELFRKLDERLQDHQLAAVFFRGVGGFGYYAQNTYALASLYKNILSPLYERAPVGALFYLNIDFGSNLPQKAMHALSTQGFRILGPDHKCYVLEKTAEKEKLPSIAELDLSENTSPQS